MSHGTDDAPEPEVGSLAEETARLLDALEGWTRRRDPHDAEPAEEPDHHAHDAPGAPSGDCRLCPLCQGARLMRSVTPEVRDHLTSAVGSLIQAASAMVAAHSADSQPSGPRVQHIDLDADVGDADVDADADDADAVHRPPGGSQDAS